ncbi:RNA polymerase sigma factor [Colwellia psychrerythraea]|uniref:RNA polymerase, sigma-24 subunit, RpoE, ECF subfamily n=1 Tax=Colwellia psychrerythraea TaxID=28229 RepID=A0A099KNN3_COLPS|nr:RNA polymerase sigma factor [Colwellia psychrerythraea]KGJ92071.1 RNA polymerase, sigma-24 subunit, RpoE, ECF subfamily [Colwellia psychrerythraea]
MDIWDEQLVDEMKQGDHKAFERCYRLISPHIFTVIFRICRNEASSQELLQDTFLDIFEKLHSYSYKQSFLAWAKRIAFNNTLNFIKKHERTRLVDEVEIYQDEIECNLLKQLSDSQLIESLLAKSSKIERLVLWLFIVEEYTHEEIAKLLAKSPSYSKSMISRLLKRIKLSNEVKKNAS